MLAYLFKLLSYSCKILRIPIAQAEIDVLGGKTKVHLVGSTSAKTWAGIINGVNLESYETWVLEYPVKAIVVVPKRIPKERNSKDRLLPDGVEESITVKASMHESVGGDALITDSAQDNHERNKNIVQFRKRPET